MNLKQLGTPQIKVADCKVSEYRIELNRNFSQLEREAQPEAGAIARGFVRYLSIELTATINWGRGGASPAQLSSASPSASLI